MHQLQCTCGQVSGQVLAGWPSNRVRCYCADCRAFARFFGPDAGVLDFQGGTEIVQVARSRLRFDRGLDQLACLRLSPKGLLRWYARCCQTPIGNTLANPKIPIIGLIHTCLDAAALDHDFGPVSALVHTHSAVGEPKPRQHGFYGAIARCLLMIARDRVSGRYRRSPLFSDTGLPLVAPHLLGKEDVARLRRDA